MKPVLKRLAAGMTAALLALTLTSCGSEGEASSDSTLTLGIQENYASFLLQVALEEGYLEEAGIDDVKITLFTDLPAMFSAVQKGQLDLGMQTIPVLSAFNQSSKGDPLRLVQQFGNTTRWYSRNGLDLPRSGDATWQEVVTSWKGRKIGVPAAGSFMDKWLRFMLEQVGLDPEKDVEIAVVGVQSSAAALKQGLVDVVGVTSGGAAAIENQGVGSLAMDYPTGPPEFQDLLVSVYFGAESRIEEDEERYRDIAAAMEKARTFVADPANRDAAIAVLVDRVGLEEALAAKVFDIDYEGISGTNLTQATYDKTVATFATLGLLPEPTPDYDEFVATEVVPSP